MRIYEKLSPSLNQALCPHPRMETASAQYSSLETSRNQRKPGKLLSTMQSVHTSSRSNLKSGQGGMRLKMSRDKMGLRIRIPRAPYSMSAWYSLEGKVLAKQTNVEISCLLLQLKMINKQHKMIQFEICINPFCQFVIWLHADGLKIRILHLNGNLLLN